MGTEASLPSEKKVAQQGGVELWSECFGSTAHEAILLIAGANAPGSMWPDALVTNLVNNGFRVIRFDHRDTGRSTTRAFEEAPYTIEDMALDAIAVLDAHEVAKAHVVGLSMGGTIAQVLALDYPERLASLSLMLTAALDVDFASAYAAAMQGVDHQSALPGPSKEVVQVLMQNHSPAKSLEAEVERRVSVWRTLNGEHAYFDAEDLASRERAAIEHAGTLAPPTNHALARPVPLSRGRELSRVTTPTLVIQGGQDPLNPRPHGRHLAELIPNAKLVEVLELGHALPSSVIEKLCHVLIAHCQGAY